MTGSKLYLFFTFSLPVSDFGFRCRTSWRGDTFTPLEPCQRAKPIESRVL
jgi:hypothetical protein